MKEFKKCKVVDITHLTSTVFTLVTYVGDIVSECKAGQFCSIYIGNNKNILPRPISISEIDKDKKTITFRVAIVGEGTNILSSLKVDDEIDILLPIGNGYEIVEDKKEALLVGGGIGIPPMIELYNQLKSLNNNCDIKVVLGFRDKNTFLVDKFDGKAEICTDDGSVGFNGNVVAYIEEKGYKPDVIYTCGPTPMLRALTEYSKKINCDIQVSMEERMACTIGACLGCVVKLKNSEDFTYKKACVDGPVFNGKEVIYE